MTPRRWPLTARLLAVTGAFVALALPLAGIALSTGFSVALTSGLDQRLQTLANVTGASLELDADGQPTLNRSLGDPRFEQVFSGWYWQVTDRSGRVWLTSRSLWDETLPVAHDAEAPSGHATVIGPRQEPLRLVRERIRIGGWPDPLFVTVAVPMAEVTGPATTFRWLVVGALVGLGVLLLALVAVQVRWGLAPLRRLRGALQEAEAGDRVSLPEDLPPDLARVAGAMNGVLERDRRLIERGRAAAGNLAHALKTPLAVLRAQAAQLTAPHDRVFEQEIVRIDTAVRHHLARASAAGSPAVAERIDLGAAARPVLDALSRMASRREIALELAVDDAARARVDPQDLQEMVGNLLENAVRWAETRVRVTLGVEAGQFRLCLDDDGPGMTPARREEALQRGRRLDQASVGEGSGLGLDIVRDLAELYRGDFTLVDSPLGGLRVEVTLPA